MAEALNTCTLSVQCPPEHLHVLSASVQGTGTSYSGARQGVFLCHKNRFVLQNALPPAGVGLLQSRDNNTVEKMKQNKPDGRCDTCPQWDRWHIRIPKLEDQQKIIELYQKSEAKTKSDFVRARLLGEAFKVIKKTSAEPCIERLTKIVVLTHKIGSLYDEAVKVLNTYHSVATAQRMISKLETYSQALIRLQEQALQLTKDFERWMNRKLTNHNLRARRKQRRSLFSLCRSDAVNGNVSRNLEAIPDHSSKGGEVRRAA